VLQETTKADDVSNTEDVVRVYVNRSENAVSQKDTKAEEDEKMTEAPVVPKEGDRPSDQEEGCLRIILKPITILVFFLLESRRPVSKMCYVRFFWSLIEIFVCSTFNKTLQNA
jgi:hypothetical protein